MLTPQPVEHLPRWLRASSFRVSKPSLNAFDGLYTLEQFLIGFSILDDDFGLPVNRQDQRIAGLLEAFEQLRRVALEVAEGSNVVGNVQHDASPNLHRI